MEEIFKKVLGQKIKKIIYSEVNHHEGKFYFNGFDTFDHAINVQMKSGYWWNLGWKDQDYFEIGKGYFKQNIHLNHNEIIFWEATDRWSEVINSTITDFKITYIDDAKFIPSKIKINFENEKKITILITEELKTDRLIPYPFDYEFGGEIYVIHNEKLLNESKLKE